MNISKHGSKTERGSLGDDVLLWFHTKKANKKSEILKTIEFTIIKQNNESDINYINKT